jgi:hypothetical protein
VNFWRVDKIIGNTFDELMVLSLSDDFSTNGKLIESTDFEKLEDEGWTWIYYSSETFNHYGSTARGSWSIQSLRKAVLMWTI